MTDADDTETDAKALEPDGIETAEAEVAEAAADAGDDDGPLSEFAAALRDATDESLRSVTRYDGERHELLYRRADLREATDPAAERERVETLVMKALGDVRKESTLDDYGPLQATVRYFEHVVVAVYPTGDWSGVVATFDREASPLVDAAVEHL
jgi:hypothetical protein